MFQAQIKTESCTTVDSGICVCAFTYRNGDFVYTFDICGGTYREGELNGLDYVTMYEDRVRSLHHTYNV